MGMGNPHAKIMFVVESPGFEEDLRGEAFVGPNASVLYELIKEHIDLDDVYITNAVKCAMEEYTKPSKKDINCCRENLVKEIKEVNPNVICCLGAVALEAVLRRTGITKLRNNVYYSEELHTKVVPIYHPAFVLRNPGLEEDVITGIKLVAEEAKKKSYKKKEDIPIKHLDANTPALIDKVLTKLEKLDHFVFDLETTSLDHREAEILCFAFSWGVGIGVTIPYNMVTPEIKQRLYDLFRSNKLKIGQNVKFDLKILKANGFKPLGPYYCTLSGIALVDENMKDKSLEALTLQYTDVGEYWKPLDEFKAKYCKENKIKLKDFSYGFIPYDILCLYAQYDGDVTYRIYKIVDRELKRQKLYKFFRKYTIPTLKILLEMEFRGILVDRKKLKKLARHYKNKINNALAVILQDESVLNFQQTMRKEKIRELALRWENGKTLKTTYATPEEYAEVRLKEKDITFNPRSVLQLRRILFEQIGLIPRDDELTDKKAPSTDVKVLTRLANEGIEICEKIMVHRKLTKFMSTYIVSSYLRSKLNNRIHPTYKQHFAVTGRLSSANPNFQNIPRDAKDYKSCLIADPGYTIVKADLAQAEFRCWAHYSNDTGMLGDIAAGLDIHKRTASELYGIPESEVTPDQRTFAKNCVFGLMYGRGPYAIAAQYGISVEEAIAVRKLFFGRYPRAATWLKLQVAHAQEYAYVQTWMGRIRRLPEIHSLDPKVAAEAGRQAKNSPIQGLASDMNNYYMVHNVKMAKKQKLDFFPMATVHDANFLQVRTDQVSDLVGIMKHVVKTAFPEFRCAMKLDFEIGLDLGNLEKLAA